MEAGALLELMKGYFQEKKADREILARFAEQSPRALLKESLDVVDFVVYLEEKLDREIDINQFGEVLGVETFRQLAEEISGLIAADAASATGG